MANEPVGEMSMGDWDFGDADASGAVDEGGSGGGLLMAVGATVAVAGAAAAVYFLASGSGSRQHMVPKAADDEDELDDLDDDGLAVSKSDFLEIMKELSAQCKEQKAAIAAAKGDKSKKQLASEYAVAVSRAEAEIYATVPALRELGLLIDQQEAMRYCFLSYRRGRGGDAVRKVAAAFVALGASAGLDLGGAAEGGSGAGGGGPGGPPRLVPPQKLCQILADMELAFSEWLVGARKSLASEPAPAFKAKLTQALVEAMEGDNTTQPPTPGHLYDVVLPAHGIRYNDFMGSLSQYLQQPPSKEVQAMVGGAYEKLIAHVRKEHQAAIAAHGQ
jgi:hypothetical protein